MPLFRLFHLDMLPRSSPGSEEIDEARFRAGMGEVRGAVKFGLYSEVAHVECGNIDRLFPLTNHIEHDWTEGPAVQACTKPARSSSVGDIAMEQESGNLLFCAMVGWQELDLEDAAEFREQLGGGIEELAQEQPPGPGA